MQKYQDIFNSNVHKFVYKLGFSNEWIFEQDKDPKHREICEEIART